jgi:predicted ATPase/DNA-binding SARP family transcriptional activator
MARLNLFLLGTPRIELAQQPLMIKRRRARALLFFLAVTGTPYQRETLASLLWPESDHERAHGSLRRHVSELNLLLGGGWLTSDREQIGLQPGVDLWVDVAQFEQDLAECQRHGHATYEVCAACITPLTQAVTLYRDDFLTGFTLPDCPAFDEWQFFQAEQLRHAFAVGLARLVQAYCKQDEPELAIPHAQRWVRLDPLHEPAHRQLMQLYAQSGQQAAALRQYELCRQTLANDLGVAPEPETSELYERIRGRQWGAPDAAVSPASNFPAAPAISWHNLPTPTTPFVGRLREIADLRHLLRDASIRLVTILGPGGMGKTRLALEVATCYLDKDQERVVFVALSAIQTAEDLVNTMADAVGYLFQSDGRSPEQQLLDYFRRKQMLLVLDNVEQVAAGVGFVNEILEAAPGVHVLATSRERLQLSGEIIFALGGMPLQSWKTVEDALAHDTVQLFVQAARRVQPTYELVSEHLPSVASICRRVGGMPLGILLAAGWVDLLSPVEIASEIDQSLNILQTELRDVPERQRNMRAVFEHAWRRLSEMERVVLMKLAVFRDGFTRSAAQSIAGATLWTLSALVSKSLVQREAGGRYSVHELLRQYAEEELEIAGAAEATRDAHSAYFATFLAQREVDLKGFRQKAALDEIAVDFENVRRAWQWSSQRVQTKQLAQAIESLGMLYEWRGRLEEGARLFAHTAEQLVDVKIGAAQHLLINALIWQARFCQVLGQSDQARHLLQQSLALLDSSELVQHDTRLERAAILKELGRLAYDLGDRTGAGTLYAQSLALYRDLRDRWRQAKVLLELESVGRNLHGLTSAKEHQQQAEAAKGLVLESLAIFRDLGDQANIASGLFALGVTLLTLGRPSEAQLALEEAVALCQALGSRSNTFAEAIGYLGVAEEFLGLYGQMHAHGQFSLVFAQETGSWQGLRLGYYLIGGAALAQQEYQDAEMWLAKNVALSRTKGRGGTVAFGLTGWALATYWLGDKNAAQQQLVEALEIAVEIRTVRATVHGLLLAALLLADQGEREQAIELYALVSSYPFAANSQWCHDVAGRYLVIVAEILPPKVVAAAWQRGQARNVWTTAEEVLVWLQAK